MKQWEKRIISLNNIYRFLTTELTNIANRENLDGWIIEILDYAFINKNMIIEKVEPFLNNDWTWDRILPINQAIIILAYSEKEINKTDKAIIIDQSIKTAKNYSDASSYKFINLILDKILK